MASWCYRALRPTTVYADYSPAGDPEKRYAMLFSVTPVEERRSIGWMWTWFNYGHDVPLEQHREWSIAIVMEDLPIVASQRPELLPLDLQAELHHRSDRLAVAYRKWLDQLGVKLGTTRA